MFVVGHTHKAAIEHSAGVTVVNGGSVGAGGTGNLTEPTDYGIARLIYTAKPSSSRSRPTSCRSTPARAPRPRAASGSTPSRPEG